MKVIISPKQEERAEYFSDFSNKSFGKYYPDAVVKFEFNYGSRFDESRLKLHLSDDEVMLLLDEARKRLSKENRAKLQEFINDKRNDYGEAISQADWEEGNQIYTSISLLRYMLGENIDD